MNNKPNTALRTSLTPSQDKKLRELKTKVRTNHNMGFNKTDIVKIALAELFENIANDVELENLLIKYNYV